ncbi:T-cell-specific surface glycoprotein CD28 homolog isoform X2 [Oryzias melastigma]|uniref:T-cell-specific surface glycoprotein CD28 homolog isoform X2 n=1 Tax=Oryzias melastigma TaxID=30732 RepID=UPI00168D7EED|nr:T-cell-specific surface glycoprotein CD28 homolog isoform X2 [Oryzias melastigma]
MVLITARLTDSQQNQPNLFQQPSPSRTFTDLHGPSQTLVALSSGGQEDCQPLLRRSAVKVVQPYRVESTDGRARIQCVFHPHKNPEDLKVTLLRGLHGRQELCSFFLNLTGQTETHGGRQGRCSAQTTDGAVEVALSNLTASDTDIYRCEIQTFYPPPYLQLTGNGTLVHVIERPDCPSVNAQRQHEEEEEEEKKEETVTAASAPVAVLVTVIICVLVIIIYLQIVQCERNRREVVRTPLPYVHHRASPSSFLTKSIV